MTRPTLASGGLLGSCAHSTGSRAFGSNGLRRAPGLEVLDRDGTAITGAPAVVFALSRLPLTAWFALPLCSSRRPPDPMIARRVWRAGLALALLLAVAFVVLAPPERCPTVSAGELRGSAQAAVDWFVRNQDSDGSWLYLYNAEDDFTPAEYNPVRHAGVTMGLYQAAAAGLPGALRSADRGTDWALERLVQRTGWAAVALDDRVTTAQPRCSSQGLRFAGRPPATGATTTCWAASGASCSPRPSRRVRCSRTMT